MRAFGAFEVKAKPMPASADSRVMPRPNAASDPTIEGQNAT